MEPYEGPEAPLLLLQRNPCDLCERLTEEAPQAWQFGPVFPSTFRGLKDGWIKSGEDSGFSKECDLRWLPIIDQAVETMGKYSANRLSAWSHLPGSPWAKASNDGQDLFVQIPEQYIKDYFSSMVTHGQGKPEGNGSRCNN